MDKDKKELDVAQSSHASEKGRLENVNWRPIRFGEKVLAVSEDGCLLPYEPSPEDFSVK